MNLPAILDSKPVVRSYAPGIDLESAMLTAMRSREKLEAKRRKEEREKNMREEKIAQDKLKRELTRLGRSMPLSCEIQKKIDLAVIKLAAEKKHTIKGAMKILGLTRPTLEFSMKRTGSKFIRAKFSGRIPHTKIIERRREVMKYATSGEFTIKEIASMYKCRRRSIINDCKVLGVDFIERVGRKNG